VKGKEVKSLADISQKCTMLIICEDYYERVDVSDMLDSNEGVDDFANRMVNDALFSVEPSCANTSMTPRGQDIHHSTTHSMKRLAQSFAKRKMSQTSP